MKSSETTPVENARPKQVPSVQLTGAAEGAYVRRVTTALRTARLNNQYPDPRRLATHIGCMDPAVHGGLYPGVQVDIRSGLPTYKDWTRVQTDCAVAAGIIDDMPSPEELEARARKAPSSIYGKQLLKHRYYSRLLDVTPAPSAQIDVSLRRVEPSNQTAYFHVVLDKLDVSGVFVRYTIDLGQQDSVWNRPMVTLTQDTAGHTEALRSLVYQFTSFDAEFMFAKLVSVGGLVVERVVKATVGPIFFAGMQGPVPLAPILATEGAFIATFSLDMAACDLAADRDNDPLDDMLEDRLSETARDEYRNARQRRGYEYKLFKDRKFVVPRSLQKAVAVFCRECGTRNIIYVAGGQDITHYTL